MYGVSFQICGGALRYLILYVETFSGCAGEEFDQCQDEYLQVCMAIGTTQCKHHSDEFCGDIFFQNR